MSMACDFDVYSDFTNFLVQKIDDETEIVVEKKVNQSEKEWANCLKEVPVFTIREIENQRIKRGECSSAIMKITDRGKRLKEERYLSADNAFAANIERIFYVKHQWKEK